MDKFEDLIVTGQIGHKPLINLIDGRTMLTLSVIMGNLQKGIGQICFSHDGKLLAGSAMDDEHHLAVYNIENRNQPELLAFGKGCRDIILDLKFSKNNTKLILGTKRELYFANFQKGKIKLKKASGWGREKTMCLSLGFTKDQDLLVGLNTGRIAVVKGYSVCKQLDAHKKCVYALSYNKSLSRLASGGADGVVLLWDGRMKLLKKFKIND